jgi:hypothetical protein
MDCGVSGRNRVASGRLSALALDISTLLVAGAASAADSVKGQVLGGGAPIAKSTVTLWAASAGAPKQLAQTQTGADGRFQLRSDAARGKDTVLYLVAKGGQATVNKASGDNPAIALMTVLGAKPRASVIINEMTTVASVWTHAQFLDGTAIKRSRARPAHRGGQRAQLRRPRDRWVGKHHPGSAEQQPDTDDGELRHAGGRAVRLRHEGVDGRVQ